jgi:hypothetical protein
MAWAEIRQGALRGVVLTLAVMALAMRLAIPQGFMLAGSETDAGPQLVICTGHGPLKTGPASPAEKSKPGSACVFAGHGAGAAPEPPPQIETAAFPATAGLPRAIPADLAPGRGLAAPPPPSLGPPPTV